MKDKITIALAGNPNSGKTTIFNNLTGAHQHVGNYPGVTVEKRAGSCRHHGTRILVVDLPGTYSLTAYTTEEVIARDFVIEEKPDVVVDVVDVSNLERNLYLAVQFLELKCPLVLAFNMSDMAKQSGMRIDAATLVSLLGTPIVETVGHKRLGMEQLLDTVVETALRGDRHEHADISYGRELNEEIQKIADVVASEKELAQHYGARWIALKLLEEDSVVQKTVREKAGKADEVFAVVDASARHLRTVFGDAPEIVIADRRYGYISGACQEAVTSSVESRHTMSDQIDKVLTHRVLGLPIFLALMYAVFFLTFGMATYPLGWLEAGFGWLGGAVSSMWPSGTESILKSLIVDGIIAGVGGVLAFVPIIFLLFASIAILEDTGYMARAAFIVDHLMHKIGLHGKSFIPMLIGFGCTVPAILATRTLESRRDRLTTILILPLMSCGARFPIYALIIPAFFPEAWQAPLVWVIYIIGIVMAAGAAKLLRSTIFRGETEHLVMELPPYRMPTVRGILIHTWERTWCYIRKAGTIILGVSVLLWALTTFPKSPGVEDDYEARIATTQTHVLESLGGLGDELGMPHGSTALQEALGAEFGIKTSLLVNSGGADEATDAEAASLAAEFIEVRDRVLEARDLFQTTVRENALREGTSDYRAAKTELERRLAEERRVNPTVYEAVARYLDEVRSPYLEAIGKAERHKRVEQLTYSLAGRVGHAMEPALRPLGFDWKIGTALLGALGAKELFIAQMGILYAVGEADGHSNELRMRLRENYSPLVAVCIMLFCLLSSPCMATFVATRRESGEWRWALLQLGGLTALAYVVTLIVHQVGLLLGLGIG